MKKLILITAVIIISTTIKATITVTSVGIFSNAIFNETQTIDLDNDGTPDFSFHAFKVGSFSRIEVNMLSANSEMASLLAGTVQVAKAMDFGDNFTVPFLSTTTFLYHHIEFTPMTNAGNKYIALRLFKGGNYHYGWVQLEVGTPTGEFVYIIDYGYEDLPNILITAGQTISSPVSVEKIANGNTFSVYPNPTKNKLTIKNLNNKQVSSIKLYTITGVLAKEINIQNNALDVSNLKKGIYLLEIIADNNKMIKKIIKD